MEVLQLMPWIWSKNKKQKTCTKARQNNLYMKRKKMNKNEESKLEILLFLFLQITTYKCLKIGKVWWVKVTRNLPVTPQPLHTEKNKKVIDFWRPTCMTPTYPLSPKYLSPSWPASEGLPLFLSHSNANTYTFLSLSLSPRISAPSWSLS